MRFRLHDLHIVPRPGEGGRAAGAPGGLANTWECPRCGTERHFAGPVPAAEAAPCAACGESTMPFAGK